MSPRRSSRARTSQPSSASLHQGSSNSSESSSRADRNTRSTLRQESHAKSLTPPLSTPDDSDEMDGPEVEARQTRQKKREHEPLDEEDIVAADEEAVNEEAEEEELTRCVCKRQEYPGLPVPLLDSKSHQSKESQLAASSAVANLPEDAGSLFIQCDDCKVWQHGGCVGIMDEAMSPDNYYCEECRKDLHKLLTGARGQRYSRYLPVTDGLNAKLIKPVATAKEMERRLSKDSDVAKPASVASLSSVKRRSTMNSRAAFDEEEALRKAIEESKSDGSNGNRRGKRLRDDSEETKHDIKRRKTTSDSGSPPNLPPLSPAMDSDNEGQDPRNRTSVQPKRVRRAVSSAQRERETRDRDRERERERAEAAGRRKGRAERRHVEGSEPLDEVLQSSVPVKASVASRAARQPVTSKLAVTPPVPVPSVSHKKQARPGARRGRVGRNQYTRDRDPPAGGNAEAPRPTISREGDQACNGDTGGSTFLNGSKAAKPRNGAPSSRASMNDLRKRAAGILEYISRTQVEMAREKTPPASVPPVVVATTMARPNLMRTASVNEASRLGIRMDGTDDKADSRKVEESAFKDMTSLQMMDLLTRELVHWQKNHGKWGDK